MKAKSLQLLSLSISLFFNANCFDPDALQRAKSEERNLAGADLENAELSGENLSGKNFWEANFKNARLNSSILEKTIFENTDLTNANLSATKDFGKSWNQFTQDTNLFINTAYASAIQTIKNRKPSWYATKRSFKTLGGSLASFGCMCRDIVFQTNSDSKHRNRIGANFARVHAQGADFSNTYLMNAIFEDADLKLTNLRNVILFGANLRNATLDGANLKYAQLEGACVEGTSFKGATGLTMQQKHYLAQHGAINVYTEEEEQTEAKKIQRVFRNKRRRQAEAAAAQVEE